MTCCLVLTGASALARGRQPRQQLQGALGIGHAFAAGDEGVDLLSRQAEHAPEIHLGAVVSEVWPEGGAQFIPERRFGARPERGAHLRTLSADAIGFYRVFEHLLASLEEEIGGVGVKPKVGMKARGHVIYWMTCCLGHEPAFYAGCIRSVPLALRVGVARDLPMAIHIGCGSWTDDAYAGLLYAKGWPKPERLAATSHRK